MELGTAAAWAAVAISLSGIVWGLLRHYINGKLDLLHNDVTSIRDHLKRHDDHHEDHYNHAKSENAHFTSRERDALQKQLDRIEKKCDKLLGLNGGSE